MDEIDKTRIRSHERDGEDSNRGAKDAPGEGKGCEHRKCADGHGRGADSLGIHACERYDRNEQEGLERSHIGHGHERQATTKHRDLSGWKPINTDPESTTHDGQRGYDLNDLVVVQ